MPDEPNAAVDDFDVADTPDLSPPSAEGSPSEPAAPAAPETPEGAEEPKPAEEAATPTPANPYAGELKKAGLREIAGEAPDATVHRLLAHYQGKGDRHYRDLKEQERKIDALHASLEPIIRSYYRQERAEAAAAAAAQIPDKETDPEGYKIWLAEEAIRRDEARRQEEAQRDEEGAQAARQRELAEIDESGFAELSYGLGLEPGSTADPELVEAYDLLTKTAYRGAKMAFPNASEEQIQEFLSYAQQLDVRNWKAQGLDVREAVKQRVLDIREVFGLPAPTPGENGGAPSPEAAKAVTAAPTPPPQPSPAAARIAAEAAASARRQPVTATAATRPAGLPGQKPDPLLMDEDDYVEAVQNGMWTEEERIAPHRRER